jgi:hypothetical protein
MAPRGIAQDLESFILHVDQALAWLGALGIQPHHTRFSEYRKILGTVREHKMAGTLNELRSIVPLEQYRIAFIESTHLVAVAKTFTRVPGPHLKEKIRVAVTGPVHPSDEKKGGSKARDFLFELSVAAFFRKRNLPVLTCYGKDLIVRMPSCKLLVECKRPQSKKKVRRSIKDATDQLMKHFKNHDRGTTPHGLIVLDISVVMNPQTMILVADSIEAIIAELHALFARFLAEFKSPLEYRRDKRILGVLAFAKVLGYHTVENHYINCQRTGIFIHAQPGTYEAMLAEKLYARLMPPSEAV